MITDGGFAGPEETRKDGLTMKHGCGLRQGGSLVWFGFWGGGSNFSALVKKSLRAGL